MSSNNEKVSDLIELDAPEIQPNDVFLVTDMSQLESKKLPVGQLLTYIESSGSFSAYYSSQAGTASYVLASNVAGIIPLATNSSQSISSSWSAFSNTSSYSMTAISSSWASSASVATVNTASYLLYSGTPNGTASYAVSSSAANIANIAQNAGFLIYNAGSNNGTAAYAISSSISNSSSYSITSSYANTSLYSITSSISNVAITSSFYNGPRFGFGPTFTTPSIILGPNYTSPISFQQIGCVSSNLVPSGTKVVILDAWVINPNSTTVGYVFVSTSSLGLNLSQGYVLLAYATVQAATNAQGSFPLDPNGNLCFSVTQGTAGGASNGITIRLIGYY